MRRFTIIIVAAAFMAATFAAAGEEEKEEEKKGIRKALQTVESTTEQANTEIGYVIGITALTPVVFTAALTWQLISAPLTALNDTFDAVTTVYKKLKAEPSEETVELPSGTPEE